MEDIPKLGAEYLLTNGVLGFTSLLFMFVSGYLYREREKDRRDHTVALDARDQAHAVEIAQWVKLHLELQKERLADVKVQNDTQTKSMDLIQSLFNSANRGGRIEKAS